MVERVVPYYVLQVWSVVLLLIVVFGVGYWFGRGDERMPRRG